VAGQRGCADSSWPDHDATDLLVPLTCDFGAASRSACNIRAITHLRARTSDRGVRASYGTRHCIASSSTSPSEMRSPTRGPERTGDQVMGVSTRASKRPERRVPASRCLNRARPASGSQRGWQPPVGGSGRPLNPSTGGGARDCCCAPHSTSGMRCRPRGRGILNQVVGRVGLGEPKLKGERSGCTFCCRPRGRWGRGVFR
jgi:hypothetical protein